jgi:hypothetical protein
MYLDITDRNNFIFLRKLKPLFEKIKAYGNKFLIFSQYEYKLCYSTMQELS